MLAKCGDLRLPHARVGDPGLGVAPPLVRPGVARVEAKRLAIVGDGSVEIPLLCVGEAATGPGDHPARVEAKRLDPGSQFALIAAREAWADSGITDIEPERLGVDWSTGIGGVWTLLDAWDTGPAGSNVWSANNFGRVLLP